MSDTSPSEPIAFSKRREPPTATFEEREAAIISRLTEVARTHGLKTLSAEQDIPGLHHGELSFLPTDGGQEVTLIVKKRLVSDQRDKGPLDIDTGQLFGMLKLAAASSQLPYKPKDREPHAAPHVAGSSITFSSMEALEKAVHAIDPWARARTPEGRGAAAAR